MVAILCLHCVVYRVGALFCFLPRVLHDPGRTAVTPVVVPILPPSALHLHCASSLLLVSIRFYSKNN
uniref:Putative secreted peptide n=1 Tax=Anopheles braziliensis TaxID=58242 RepID=A0A2M3ZX58_9DIPT